MTTRPQIVEQAGRALYGEDWQQPLARLIGVNGRTMQRIAKAGRDGDDYPVPAGVLLDLVTAMRRQSQQLHDAAADIEAKARAISALA